jgi:hypothetical protein
VLLLSARLVGTGAGRSPVRYVPTGALTREGLAVRAGWSHDDEDQWDALPQRSRPVLLASPRLGLIRTSAALEDRDHLADDLSELVVASSRGLFLRHPAVIARARARTAAWEKRIARSYRVHLSLTTRGGPGPRTIASLHLETAAGRNAFYEVGTERAFLADWDVEVAQEARVGDPIIGHAFGGLLVNLRLDPAPGGGRVAGRVALTLVDLHPTFETHRAGNERTGIVELARARRLLIERDLVLVPGKPIAIEAGCGEDGRRAVLEIGIEKR